LNIPFSFISAASFKNKTKSTIQILTYFFVTFKFYLVRADAELEFVVSARLHDDGVAGVQLINVQVAGILLVLCKMEKDKTNYFQYLSFQ